MLLKQSARRELVNGAVAKKANELDGIDFVGVDVASQRLLHLEPSADCDSGTISSARPTRHRE